MLYSAFTNDIYAATPAVDASAYDGTTCTPSLHSITSCTVFGSHSIVFGGQTFYIINAELDGLVGLYCNGNFNGFTFEVLSNVTGHPVNIFYESPDTSTHLWHQLESTSGPFGLTFDVIAVAVVTADHDADAHPFTIQICPPTA
jgi:hypothetical protein